MIEIKFKAQRASGEWVYFTLDGLVNDPRLLAEYSRWKNITQYTEEKKRKEIDEHIEVIEEILFDVGEKLEKDTKNNIDGQKNMNIELELLREFKQSL